MNKNNANINGLNFERGTHLVEAIDATGLFNVKFIYRGKKTPEGEVYSKKNREKLAGIFNGWSFYANFLEPELGIPTKRGFSTKNRLSKNLEPDEALVNYTNNMIYIIEKKYQGGSGSVDEKLQTCKFKLQQYEKLLKDTNFDVTYSYLLSSFYKNEAYNDVFAFIKKERCSYFFDSIPLDQVGLFGK